MRILQVAHGFPPAQSGGVEQYTLQLSMALQARGHDVAVYCRQAKWALPEYAVRRDAVAGVTVYRINNTWRACDSFEQSYQHPEIARRFGACLDELRPDMVHIQHLVHLSTRLLEEAALRGIPVALTVHDYWFWCNQGQLLRRDGSLCRQGADGNCQDCAGLWLGMGRGASRALTAVERWWPDVRYRTSWLRSAARRWMQLVRATGIGSSSSAGRMRARHDAMRRVAHAAGAVLAPSLIVRDRLLAFGVPPERVIYMPLGIQTDWAAGVRRVASKTLRIGYLGRLIPAKGLHVLLDAAALLRDHAVEVHIFGEVPPYGDVDRYARQMRRRAAQLPRVRWHGPYTHDELPDIFSRLDVAVAPSIWYENCPLVILEAFAAGVPVIASDLGGMRELVRDGRNGRLFPRGDAQALAERLQCLAADRAEVGRLRAGIAPVKTMAMHAREMEGVYQSLADAAGASYQPASGVHAR